MTAQPPQTAAKTEPQPPALARLRMRETALRQQALQLQARAEHLERVGSMQVRQLTRRVDAHEKIVLGALVKKAGLAWPLPETQKKNQRHRNDDDSMPVWQGVAAQSTAYDREFILGALLWLVSALNQPANAVVTVPERQRLLADGSHALGKPSAPNSP
jgi:hypothetical protein